MVFNVFYAVWNAILLGNDSEESNVLLAAYGIGSMTASCTIYATGYTFNSYLSTLVSQAFG